MPGPGRAAGTDHVKGESIEVDTKRPGKRVGCRGLLGASVLVFLPLIAAAPATAATCAPPSAEHAFEELLEALADDSAAESEAWRIAEEQEAGDRFESPETIRRIEGLAARERLVYDCGTRGFRSAGGGPTPGELEQEGDPAGPDDRAAPPPDAAPASRPISGQGPAGGDGSPAGSPDRGPAPNQPVAPVAGGQAPGGPSEPPLGGRAAAPPTGGGALTAPTGADDAGGPSPASTTGEGEAVAVLPAGSGPAPTALRPLGVLLLVTAAVSGAAGLAARRS